MKIHSNILLLVCIAWVLIVPVQAQDFNWKALNERSNRLSGKLSGSVYYMPADGNSRHFYHNDWPQGSILLEDGDRFDGLRIRYLAYGDELVVYNSNLSQLFIVDKEKVAEFEVQNDGTNQKFIKLYFNGFMSGNRYFEQLYDGTRQLLAYRSIDELRTEAYKDNSGRLRNTKLKLNTSYYMYSPDTGFKRLQPRRKSFFSLFPDRKRELRQIFRRNDFYRLNEWDMIQIFNLMEEGGFFL